MAPDSILRSGVATHRRAQAAKTARTIAADHFSLKICRRKARRRIEKSLAIFSHELESRALKVT
jgi:hypothetical protein